MRPEAQSLAVDFARLPVFAGVSSAVLPTISGRVQRKLMVGAATDPLERDADRIADAVMRAPAAPHGNSCGCRGETGPGGECKTCRTRKSAAGNNRIQRSATGQAPTMVPRAVHNVLGSAGRPLDPVARAFMEPRFQRGLGDVRIHDDTSAASSAALVGARAYTVGRHVVFGAGEYGLASNAGRRLLAHELAHVVQQERGEPGLMRTALPFESTIQLQHRVLKGETKFVVKKGAIAVTADARWHLREEEGSEEPQAGPVPDETKVCGTAPYQITVSQIGALWDSEYGSCSFPSTGPGKAIWNKLPEDTYYLTISAGDHNPHCLLEGEVKVEELSGVTGDTCTQLPPGPLEILHDALNLAGLIPALGAIPDGINAGIYVIEGDWTNAGFSAAAALPFLGDAFQAARQGEKLLIKVAGKDVERLGAKKIGQALEEAKAEASAARAEAKSAEKGAVHDSEEAGKASKDLPVPARTPVEEGLAEVDHELAAERANVAGKRAAMSPEEWARSRAGATKGLYNLLERRAVLNRMKAFPGRTYLEQAEVAGVRSAGKLTRTAEISKAGKGRIADILELDGSKATLEDLKSPSTQLKSVKGGMSSPVVEAEFRSTSEIAKQHEIEQEVIAEARRTGGKVVVTGRDPLTGATRALELDPGAIRSRVTDYTDLGNN